MAPYSVSVNSADGSCWVADYYGRVVHLSATGAEQWRQPVASPNSVSVNPTDGSCWVGFPGDGEPRVPTSGVAHFSSTGTVLDGGGSYGQYGSVSSVAVNPADGSCWVTDKMEYQIVHLSEAGAEQWLGGGFRDAWNVAVNPKDGSCWVADLDNGRVVHLSATGTLLSQTGGFDGWSTLCVNPADGSCWVAAGDQVVHLSAAGRVLWRTVSFGGLYLSVNPKDGSCWVADTGDGLVMHLSAAGKLLWRGGKFSFPCSLSVNPKDGSCWVAEAGRWSARDTVANPEVIHLSSTGMVKWRGRAFACPCSVSVNPTDGSCWVADLGVYSTDSTGVNEGPAVLHLSPAGVKLWQSAGDTFSQPWSVAVNGTDGSCWVADCGSNQAVYLSAAGAELWRGGGFSWLDSTYSPAERGSAFSVNPTDGSCWVADSGNSQAVHLAVAPAANFSANKTKGAKPLTVTFTDATTNGPTSWSWSFGDGGTSTARSPRHTYTTGGSFTVALTATNAVGSDTCTKSGYIKVISTR